MAIQIKTQAAAFGQSHPFTKILPRRGGARRRNPIPLNPARLLFAAFLLLAAPVFAASDDNPLRPADTTSPQGTLKTFVESVTEAFNILQSAQFAHMTEPGLSASEAVEKQVQQAEDAVARAIRTLDLSDVPPTAVQDIGLEKVLLLKEVLDRIKLPDPAAIPDKAAAKTDEIQQWRLPGTEIVIAKVAEGARGGEFLFSIDTVARVDEFYRKVRKLPYQTKTTEGFYEFYITTPGKLLPPKWLHWLWELPEWARTPFHGPTLWQWVGLALAVVIGIFLPCAFQSLCARWPIPESLQKRAWRRLLLPSIIMLSLLLVRYLSIDVVNVTGQVADTVVFILVALFYLTSAWLAVVVGIGIAEAIISSPRIDSNSIDANMLRVLFRVLSSAVAVTMVFFGAERLGIPVLPLLAGLGVGGLALALAAQPTIENLIGGIMLYSDRPVRVGDLCEFGSLRGRVENIGLRSTRIRSIDRKLITVPNAEFARMNLVNFTQRDRMMLRTTIGLRYETTPEQLRYVLAKVRELLIAHPRILPVPLRVRFVGFGAYSLDFEIFAFANTRLFPEFSAIREDILLRVIDTIKEAGTDFAFPSQTAYLSRDSGLDADKGKAAAAEVQRWREDDTLPFPDYTPEQKEEMADRLDYPPDGSPAAKEAKLEKPD